MRLRLRSDEGGVLVSDIVISLGLFCVCDVYAIGCAAIRSQLHLRSHWLRPQDMIDGTDIYKNYIMKYARI